MIRSLKERLLKLEVVKRITQPLVIEFHIIKIVDSNSPECGTYKSTNGANGFCNVVFSVDSSNSFESLREAYKKDSKALSLTIDSEVIEFRTKEAVRPIELTNVELS